MTVDKIWMHYYTPENKECSKQWTSIDETALKKIKTVISAEMKGGGQRFLGFIRLDYSYHTDYFE